MEVSGVYRERIRKEMRYSPVGFLLKKILEPFQMISFCYRGSLSCETISEFQITSAVLHCGILLVRVASTFLLFPSMRSKGTLPLGNLFPQNIRHTPSPYTHIFSCGDAESFRTYCGTPLVSSEYPLHSLPRDPKRHYSEAYCMQL